MFHSRALVDLDYQDPEGDYREQKSLSFSRTSVASQPLATWKFLLRNPNRRGFRYRETYLMTSGAIHQEDWVSRD